MVLTVLHKQLSSKNLTASIKNLETAYMDSEGVKTRKSHDPKGVGLINVSFSPTQVRSCNLQCTEAETIYSHFRSLLAASAFPPRYAILLSFFFFFSLYVSHSCEWDSRNLQGNLIFPPTASRYGAIDSVSAHIYPNITSFIDVPLRAYESFLLFI